LTGGDVLTLTAGHRRCVDAKDHRHGRLVNRHGRGGDLLLDVGNRLADGDVLNPRQTDDVAGGRVGDVHALQSVEGVQLGDLGRQDGAVQLAHRHGVADLHAAVEDAADGDASQVVARIEVRDEQLQGC